MKKQILIITAFLAAAIIALLVYDHMQRSEKLQEESLAILKADHDEKINAQTAALRNEILERNEEIKKKFDGMRTMSDRKLLIDELTQEIIKINRRYSTMTITVDTMAQSDLLSAQLKALKAKSDEVINYKYMDILRDE